MKKNELLSVKDVCRNYGITRKTLFYYDRIGLIRPAQRVGTQMHKMYGEMEVRKLEEVLSCRQAGLKVSEIRHLLTASLSRQESISFLQGVRERLVRERKVKDREISNLDAKIAWLMEKEET
jgi:DNA-binding transcriptional MerR regulator